MAFAAHDQTYLLDYFISHIPLDKDKPQDIGYVIADFVVQRVQEYEQRNLVKFLGAGLAARVTDISPTLCSRLWLEVDIVPIVLSAKKKDLHSSWD